VISLLSDSSSDELTSDSEAEESESSEEEEEEALTLAQRVKRRTGRAQTQNAYSYQSLEQQQHMANQETVALSDMVEVRDVPGMNRGLFAKANIQRGQLSISYFGRHYSSETQYDEAFPNDDGMYVMEHDGEYFDGEPVEQLGKYANHSRSKRNLDFVLTDTPVVQLQLWRDVKADEQLLTDYGPAYPYEQHGFSRDD
jgi:hypothetical protein